MHDPALTPATANRTRDLSLRTHLPIGFIALGVPLAGIVLFARLDETVSARGRLDFTALTPVTARISARIERVLCAEGQRVARDTPLFELDRAELQARHDELVARAAGLRAQREHLVALRRIVVADEAPRTLAGERRRLAAATGEERLRELLWRPRVELAQRQVLSREEETVARLEYEIARSRRDASAAGTEALVARQHRELEDLDRAVAAVETDLHQTEALRPLAERWLADATVRAPVDGVVLTATPERMRGRRLEPGEVIVELADPRRLQFVMQVDERDVSRVAPGQDVLVSLDAFPFYVYRSFHGKVTALSSAPAAGPGAGPAIFRVLVAVDDPVVAVPVDGVYRDVELRPGLGGEGSIFVNRGLGLRAYLFRSLERDRLPTSTTLR